MSLGLVVVSFLGACSSNSDSMAAGESAAAIPLLRPDEVLPPNEPHLWDLSTHCGVAFFSYKINDTWWRTAEGAGQSWMPEEWGPLNGTPSVMVVLELSSAGNQLTATYADRSVVYTPTELTEADLCA